MFYHGWKRQHFIRVITGLTKALSKRMCYLNFKQCLICFFFFFLKILLSTEILIFTIYQHQPKLLILWSISSPESLAKLSIKLLKANSQPLFWAVFFDSLMGCVKSNTSKYNYILVLPSVKMVSLLPFSKTQCMIRNGRY